MRKIFMLIAAILLLVGCQEKKEVPIIDEAQLNSISELATIKALYHNVTKDIDVNKNFWIIPDGITQFWAEYEGIVIFGIDTNAIKIEQENEKLTITIPKAKILDHQIDKDTLKKENIYVNKTGWNPKDFTAKQQTQLFNESQKEMYDLASSDTTMINTATARAKIIIEQFINNLGKNSNVKYEITWEEAK